MIIMSKEQILYLHKELINETGGMQGLKDEGLLNSALATPFQSFENQDMMSYLSGLSHIWNDLYSC